MSQGQPRLSHPQRRLVTLLLVFALSFGLAFLLMAYAGKAPAARAERLSAPLSPQLAQLEAGKEGPDSTYAGRVITYTIRVTNNLGSPANNVIVTDTWAASEGGVVAMAADFNGDYWVEPFDFVNEFTFTLPSQANMGGIAVWKLNPLPAGFRGTIEFTMTVPAALQPLDMARSYYDIGPSVLGNSVEIWKAGVSVNEPDQVVTPILGPVFNLEKFAATEPGVGPRPGRLITYSLQLRNRERTDSVAASDIVIWELLPPELAFEGAWAAAPNTIKDYDPASRRITWTLPSNFVLAPGEVTTVSFATRLPVTQAWNEKIINDTDMCWVIASELAAPVQCYNKNQIVTLGIIDKTYVTEPSNLNADTSYPNRYITYTLQVFNPLSQTVAHNMYITDVMPPTFDYIRMVEGPNPIGSEAEITNTIAWHVAGTAIPANGVFSLSWLAHIGPDTSVQAGTCRGVTYYNSAAASATEFPMVYQYGRPFVSENGMARLTLEEPVSLDKSVDLNAQIAGETVVYTATLRNVGDRVVNNIVFTDTLPEFFRYVAMVDGPPPTSIVTRTVVWNIGSMDPGEEVMRSFRATADGYWHMKYANYVDARSPDTSFCARERAKVEVLSPLLFNKEAVPSLDSGEWVVQGEWFDYGVEYWNRSSVFDYTIDEFSDFLQSGFEVDGSQYYSTTIDPPVTLLTEMANIWEHTFRVDTVGQGSGTTWCDDLRIEEDGSNPNKNREWFQDKGMFGIYVPDLEVWGLNGVEDGYMLFKPHVDFRQIIYPKKVGLSGTVEVTLSLQNNMRVLRGGTERAVPNINVEYQIPSGFEFLGMIPPSPIPQIQTSELLKWNYQNLPAGEGATAPLLHFYLAAPGNTGSPVGRATAMPADPNFCIPESRARYTVVKGVELTKKPTPDAVGPFGIVEYNLKLENLTTAPVNGIAVTDTLPPGFEFVSVLSGFPEPASVWPLVWRDISLGPNGSADDTLEIRYKTRAPGLFGVYYNMIDGVSDSTYVTRSDRYLYDVEVAVLPGVALYKTASTEQAEAGQTVVYTLTVDNRSDMDIIGLRITDTLPTGFSYVEMVSGQGPAATTPKLLWMASGLESGKKIEYVFRVLIDGQIPSDVYCNQASASAYEEASPNPPVTIPDTDMTACIEVRGLPTVTRNKSVSPSRVRAGNLVTYTISLFNETEESQTVRLTDTLPLSLTFDSVVGSTPAPQQTSPVVWNALQVGSQQTRTLVFRARVDLYARSGTYYNRLDAMIDGFVLPPKPQLARLEVEEIPRYDLQVSKSDGKITVDEGETLLYTITFTNVNEAGLRLTDIIITDTFDPLPPHAIPADVGDWLQLADNVYVYHAGDLEAGESASVEFTLQLSDSIPLDVMVISNSVQIGHDTAELAFETDPRNNQATDLDILRGPDLIITDIEIVPPQPEAGDSVQFWVTVRNQGKDGTDNAAGEQWFALELYLKGSAFEPAGPPSSIFDHAGGYWSDASGSWERAWYLHTFDSLPAGSEDTWVFVEDVQEMDDYQVYAQVDVSFDSRPDWPWTADYGLVLEAIETNNIYTYGTLSVQGRRTFLPIMTMNR
jgi:uncharacterized repeat protein (TIGR01451 family)